MSPRPTDRIDAHHHLLGDGVHRHISTKLRVASFRFVEAAGDVHVLTVPLPALGRDLPGRGKTLRSRTLNYLESPLKTRAGRADYYRLFEQSD